MDYKIEVISMGKLWGSIVPTYPETITIGRSQDLNLRISDPYLSREHFMFKTTASGKISVIKMNSKNPLFLNGNFISRDDTQLRDGDKIVAGKTIFIVHAERNRGAEASTFSIERGEVRVEEARVEEARVEEARQGNAGQCRYSSGF